MNKHAAEQMQMATDHEEYPNHPIVNFHAKQRWLEKYLEINEKEKEKKKRSAAKSTRSRKCMLGTETQAGVKSHLFAPFPTQNYLRSPFFGVRLA